MGARSHSQIIRAGHSQKGCQKAWGLGLCSAHPLRREPWSLNNLFSWPHCYAHGCLEKLLVEADDIMFPRVHSSSPLPE